MGFHFSRPLKRPISSVSVHGSVRKSDLSGEAEGMGEVGLEMRARLRGGMLGVVWLMRQDVNQF